MARHCLVCGQPFAESGGEARCPSCAPAAVSAVPAPTARVFVTEESVPAEWAVGDLLLDQYEVRGPLGEGGMARVWRIWHRGWNLELAVKTPLPDVLAQTGAQAFSDEAGTWVELGLHPHIVSCFYVRHLGGIPRVFAELVAGGSLKDWIAQERLYTGAPEEELARMVDVAIQFAWGLGYAHEQGLVHQDVKPGNVLLTDDGVAKVTDFGLARSRVLDVAGTGGSEVVRGVGGTPAYYSPEQADAVAQARAGTPLEERTWLTRRTDIWSWAASVLEMFAGERTWEWGPAAAQALAGYVAADPPAGIPAMPAELADLLGECLRLDPGDRPPNFDAIAQRLTGIYEQAVGAPYSRPLPVAAEMLADSLNNKALSLLDLGREAEAVAAWEQAFQSDAHHPESTYNLGLLRWRAGQLTDQDLVEQLIDLGANKPASWRPQTLLAQVQLERGDGDAAAACLERAAALGAPKTAIEEARGMADGAAANLRRILATVRDAPRVLRVSPSGRHAAAFVDGEGYLLVEIDSGRLVAELIGCGEVVHDACFTPDGKLLVSGGDTGELVVHETETGTLVKRIPAHQGRNGGWVGIVRASAEGRRLVSGGWAQVNTVQASDLATGRVQHVMKGHCQPVHSLEITPDGRLAVSSTSTGNAGADFSMRVWDLEDGRCLMYSEDDSCPVAITRDGHTVLSQGTRMGQMSPLPMTIKMLDSTLRIWNVQSGRCTGVLEGHTGGIESIDVSSDGFWALTAAQDRTLRVWDLASQRCERVLAGHRGIPGDARFVPGSSRAISASAQDGTIRIWDLDTGRCMRTIAGADANGRNYGVLDAASGIVFPDDQHRIVLWGLDGIGAFAARWHVSQPIEAAHALAAASEQQTAVAEARDALARGEHREAARAIARAMTIPGFERDQALLDLWYQAGQAAGRPCGLLSERVLQRIPGYGHLEISGCRIHLLPSGERVVAQTKDLETLGIWDLASGDLMGTLEGHAEGWGVDGFGLSRDGRVAFTASGDRTARLWDFTQYRQLAVLGEYDKPFSHACVSPDGRLGFAGSWDGQIFVWRVPDGRSLGQLNFHRSIIRDLLFTSDGSRCVSVSNDGALGVWRLEDLRLEHRLHLSDQGVGIWTACLTSDGSGVIAGDASGRLSFWDLGSGRCTTVLDGHVARVAHVRASSDGVRAVSADDKGGICIWSLREPALLHAFQGHAGRIQCLAVSPDGRFAFTGGDDSRLRIWDLDTGQELRALTEHGGSVWDIVISPDGHFMISGGPEMIYWRLDWDYEFSQDADDTGSVASRADRSGADGPAATTTRYCVACGRPFAAHDDATLCGDCSRTRVT